MGPFEAISHPTHAPAVPALACAAARGGCCPAARASDGSRPGSRPGRYEDPDYLEDEEEADLTIAALFGEDGEEGEGE